MAQKEKQPWIIRTYAGFANAEESNKRFLENLKNGQTGLSVAFDLPTQNGYDPDAPMAIGEVGGCGVSIAHLGDMEKLFRDIDLGAINTSMTINAPAPYLLALYLLVAEKRGVPWTKLRGTVQNDLLKEFVARGTSIFSPEASLRLSSDVITFTTEHVQHWNPINVCGYHYMESGARPQEEIGYAFGNALIVLDSIRPRLSKAAFEQVVRRISFFINSGIELVPEICKVRAYTKLWTQLCEEEYGIKGVAFRAGCQVRSLSLTAAQPENNIVRIALEALPVLLSANARVNALQLPGFREALSLPDQMEQTLSLRTQQILQHETKIADYPDIFEGNPVIENLTAQMMEQARSIAGKMRSIGYGESIRMLGHELTKAMAERQHRLDFAEDTVVGMNKFTEPVGLSEQLSRSVATAQDESFGRQRIKDLREWKENRNEIGFDAAKGILEKAVRTDQNIMAATIDFARAGGTVGEWTAVVEEATGGRYSTKLDLRSFGTNGSEVKAPKHIRIVLGKSGLDGHTNAIKTLALACRNAGMEVVFAGSKLSHESLMKAAVEEDADVLGVSCLSGAHLSTGRQLMHLKSMQNLPDLKIIMGGTIPECDKQLLIEMGIDLVVNQDTPSFETIIEKILKTALQGSNS